GPAAGPPAPADRRRRPRRPGPGPSRGPRRARRPRAGPHRRPGHPASPGPTGRKKGAPGRRCPHCRKLAWDKGRVARTVLTAAGAAALARLSLACPRCPHRLYPLDQRLGVTGFVSPQAQRLLCLAGASWSFDRAAALLAEFCGLRTCDQTVRAACHQEAAALADWLHADPQAGAAFPAAPGEVEFQADGTMVNTTAGG